MADWIHRQTLWICRALQDSRYVPLSFHIQPPIYPSEVASSRSLLLLPCQTGKLDLGLQGDPCRWGWHSKDTTPQFTLSYGKCTGMCLGGRAVVQRVSILKLPGETRMPSTAMTKGSFSENQTESCLLWVVLLVAEVLEIPIPRVRCFSYSQILVIFVLDF